MDFDFNDNNFSFYPFNFKCMYFAKVTSKAGSISVNYKIISSNASLGHNLVTFKLNIFLLIK